MAEVGGQDRQHGDRIGALPIPVSERGDREAVPEAVDAGPCILWLLVESGGGDDPVERFVHTDVVQPGPSGRDEEGRRFRERPRPFPELGVVDQRCQDRGVERDPPVLAELRLGDGDDPGLEVDLAAVEANGLADAEPCHREQTEQGLVGRGPQGWLKGAGRGHECGDVVVGEQAGRRTATLADDGIGGWHLGRGVAATKMACEPAHHAQPLRPPSRAHARGSDRPGHRHRRGDGVSARPFEVVDEVGEQPIVAAELVAQRSANSEVVHRRLAERAHRVTAGHGRAIRARASMSSLA